MPRGGARPGAGRKPKAKPGEAVPGARKTEPLTVNGVKSPATPDSWPFGTQSPSPSPAPMPEVPSSPPLLEEELTALAYFQRIYRDQTMDEKSRFTAAMAALPFEQPRPAPLGKKDGKKADAKAAGGGKFAASAPPRLAAANGSRV